MSRVIVFANRKGGCGKTTTAVNVAHGLVPHGRVLFIDMDAQAHASMILRNSVNTRPNIISVLEKTIQLDKAIEPSRIAGLDLVSSSRNLGAYELSAGTREESELILAEQLSPILGRYDYIVIDPPPTLGILMVTSLIAAREVMIPMPMHFLAMEGLAEMIQVIYRLNATHNPDLRLKGIIPTFYNKKTRIAKNIIGEIKKNFGKFILLPGIRNNITLAEAPAYNQTIFEYSPRSHGAADYRELVERGVLGGMSQAHG